MMNAYSNTAQVMLSQLGGRTVIHSVNSAPKSEDTKNRFSTGTSFSHPQSWQQLFGPSVGLNGIEYALVYVGLLGGRTVVAYLLENERTQDITVATSPRSWTGRGLADTTAAKTRKRAEQIPYIVN